MCPGPQTWFNRIALITQSSGLRAYSNPFGHAWAPEHVNNPFAVECGPLVIDLFDHGL